MRQKSLHRTVENQKFLRLYREMYMHIPKVHQVSKANLEELMGVEFLMHKDQLTYITQQYKRIK